MFEPQKYAECNKPDTKCHKVYDSVLYGMSKKGKQKK